MIFFTEHFCCLKVFLWRVECIFSIPDEMLQQNWNKLLKFQTLKKCIVIPKIFVFFFLKYSAGDVSAFFTTVLKIFAKWKKKLWKDFENRNTTMNLIKFQEIFAQCPKEKKTFFFFKKLLQKKFIWTQKIQLWNTGWKFLPFMRINSAQKMKIFWKKTFFKKLFLMKMVLWTIKCSPVKRAQNFSPKVRNFFARSGKTIKNHCFY